MDMVLGERVAPAALTAALESYFPGARVLVVETLDEIADHRAEVYVHRVSVSGPRAFPVGLSVFTAVLGGHADVELMILDLARHLSRSLRCPVLSTSVGAVKLDEEEAHLSVLWDRGEAALVSHGPDLDALEPIEVERRLDPEELGIEGRTPGHGEVF